MPGMMGADTYDAFYIAKDAIQSAGTIDKAAVRQAIENTDINQMLIQTKTGKVQFSTGVNYHEIDPVTFIEQLKWDSSTLPSDITNRLVTTRLNKLKASRLYSANRLSTWTIRDYFQNPLFSFVSRIF